jgi:hypothetical protein
METSLNIGKVIKEILYRDEALKNLVKNQVFPLIAEENTTFPFIVYRRNSIRKSNTKDYVNDEIASVDVVVACDKYSQSVEIAERVRFILECGEYEGENFSVDNISLSNASEQYMQNTYIQTLTFDIEINNF